MTHIATESSTSIGQMSLDLEMCENCRVAPWKPLTLSAVGSPANLFRSRVNGKLRPILGGYGLTSPVWWMSYDPDMSSWKTCQDFGLQLVVPKLSLTLPRSATTVDGTVFLLPPLERPISGKGSLLWRTPTGGQGGEKKEYLDSLISKDGGPPRRGERVFNPKDGKHVILTLNRQVKLMTNDGVIGDKTQPRSLNPAWVGWLMGFPSGWTDLEVSETL